MRIPDSLSSLVNEGIIDAVLRPLMSGKEAQVYLLQSGGELRVAKVYKTAQDRSFRQRAEYTEGRTVRNSRDQRAMSKRTAHGREQDEIAWRATEVDMIYRLQAAGVRVPTPYQFIDGVLIMELIVDEEGNPAPRLGDVDLDRESAIAVYDQLLRYVVQMLCAGVVHGDLSDFNVLMAPDGPVIIDFPQSVNAAGNQNARKLLLRDVDNLHRFLARFVPERRPLPYAEEMWQLYQRGELTPDVRLTGRFRAAESKVNTALVLDLIADAERDERRRRSAQGISMRGASDVAQPRAPERRAQDVRQPQAASGQRVVEHRRPQTDPRSLQVARGQNVVESRQPRPDPRPPAQPHAPRVEQSRQPRPDPRTPAQAPKVDLNRQARPDPRTPVHTHTPNRAPLPLPAAGPAQSASVDGSTPDSRAKKRRRRRRRRAPERVNTPSTNES